MSQIAYQSALDPYHTLFRFLRIGRIVGTENSLAVDAIRIVDFYLLFPFRIKGFRLKPEHRGFRKMSKRYEERMPYGEFPGDRAVFARMAPIQNASLATASRQNIIEPEKCLRDSIQFLAFDLPQEMERRIASLNEEEKDLVKFLLALTEDYSFLGHDGIKARSNLLEFRYDSIA